jgi:micrococcal nuclease
MYEYDAEILDVVDGDTIDVDVDLGLDDHQHTRIRLYGIDAPELGTDAGKSSRTWLAAQLPVGTRLRIRTIKDRKEKFGRYLGVLWPAGATRSLNDEMVELGLAAVYLGGPRK